MPAAAATQSATAEAMWSQFLQRGLPNIEGKTFTSVIITFPPGAGAAPHRHHAASAWAYVLAGKAAHRALDTRRTLRAGGGAEYGRRFHRTHFAELRLVGHLRHADRLRRLSRQLRGARGQGDARRRG
jgi:hypothetical protein